jgi:23S rRNA pseudouridine955/2504/2580 synthase
MALGDGGDQQLALLNICLIIQTFLGFFDYMPDFTDREMQTSTKPEVRLVEVSEAHEGQRLDNFLIWLCKGVPKSHLYKAVRGGEVRVNRGRCAVDYRLQLGDVVRVPPVRVATRSAKVVPARSFEIAYQDDAILVINKPAGVAVHGGSGVSHGVIESLRAANPSFKFLELVHRLDRDTSGLLMLAKRRSALVRLHTMMREGQVSKHYLAIVDGRVVNDRQHVRAPLLRWVTASGERRVRVDEAGQTAHTIVTCLTRLASHAVVDAELRTGRTHQIRVHLGSIGHPIMGDTKYGNDTEQLRWRAQGVKRMFLHAYKLSFVHPITGEALSLEAPMPIEFESMIATLSVGNLTD